MPVRACPRELDVPGGEDDQPLDEIALEGEWRAGRNFDGTVQKVDRRTIRTAESLEEFTSCRWCGVPRSPGELGEGAHHFRPRRSFASC
jgi:hypothetical protein